MVWVFTVKNIRADYQTVINRITSIFFFYTYAKISFKNLPVLSFLLIVLFCILLRKFFFTWITFCAELPLGTSRHVISSLLIYYLLWWSLKQILVSFLVLENASQFSIGT